MGDSGGGIAATRRSFCRMGIEQVAGTISSFKAATSAKSLPWKIRSPDWWKLGYAFGEMKSAHPTIVVSHAVVVLTDDTVALLHTCSKPSNWAYITQGKFYIYAVCPGERQGVIRVSSASKTRCDYRAGRVKSNRFIRSPIADRFSGT